MPLEGKGVRDSVGVVFIGRLLMYVSSFAAGVLVARLLSPELKGRQVVYLLVPSLAASFSALALAEAAVVYVASRKFDPGRVMSSLFLAAVGLGAVSWGVLGMLGAAGLVPVPEGGLTPWLGFALVFIPMMLLRGYMLALLRAVGRFRAFALAGCCEAGSYAVIMAALFVWKVQRVWAVLGGYLVSVCLTLVLVGFLLRQSGIVPRRPSWAFLRSGAWFGIRAHVGNIFHKLGLRVDLLILGYMVPRGALGVYAVMTAIAETLWILADSVGQVMLTALSRVKDARAAAARTATACRVTFTLSLVGVACAAVMAPYAVPLLYGSAYAAGLKAFNWLLPGVVFLSGSKILSKYWSSRNRPEVSSLTAFVAMVASAAGCVLLIPRHGIVGAAVASSIAYGVRFVLDVGMFVWFARGGGLNMMMVTRRDLIGVVGNQEL